jgi:putative membrane protein
MSYEVLKAIHIISLVAWFAALFYLPRLYVYHAENRENSGFVEVVKTMEFKLFNYIGLPAFVATVVTGLGLIMMAPGVMSSGGWMHAKITLVVLLAVYFFHNNALRKALAKGSCTRSGRFYRIYNEIPTLFLIVIVVLAVMKPF